jgi:hypothetical protein
VEDERVGHRRSVAAACSAGVARRVRPHTVRTD